MLVQNGELPGQNEIVGNLILIQNGLRVQIEMDELENSIYSHY